MIIEDCAKIDKACGNVIDLGTDLSGKLGLCLRAWERYALLGIAIVVYGYSHNVGNWGRFLPGWDEIQAFSTYYYHLQTLFPSALSHCFHSSIFHNIIVA